MKKSETIAWLGLREIYKLIGSEDGRVVLKLLLQKESLRTSKLIEKSAIQPARFHNLMKALVMCQVVDKRVHQDRSVTYEISNLGMNLLDLSEPLIEEIGETFKDKESMLLASIQH